MTERWRIVVNYLEYDNERAHWYAPKEYSTRELAQEKVGRIVLRGLVVQQDAPKDYYVVIPPHRILSIEYYLLREVP